ncbi:hypothetical protein SAMN05444336_103310 [Albimonas donghaensis]|uniref:Uncharacterized protein n=1 Tax=Albimonas donghaensis TaxID=356660 RepID=A0A1H2YZ57_9RHOB|nr:hypothetical protein [Albimonas donghaensis]SDX10345.1 hypothetical protein SAMN05444336_103310 [Albimonas donghaensis]
MKKFVLLAIAGLLGACTSTAYNETPEEVRIAFGGGGLVYPIFDRYDAWQDQGKKIVIDGQVISADAFAAFGADNACYTENAVFSPHAASHLGLVRSQEYTEMVAARLPTELKEWFEHHHSYNDWIGFANVSFDLLVDIWPEGACADDPYAARDAWVAKQRQREAERAFR